MRMTEQLTFDLAVAGSSPARPTKVFKSCQEVARSCLLRCFVRLISQFQMRQNGLLFD